LDVTGYLLKALTLLRRTWIFRVKARRRDIAGASKPSPSNTEPPSREAGRCFQDGRRQCSPRVALWVAAAAVFVLGGVLLAGGWVAPAVIGEKLRQGILAMIVVDSKDAQGFKAFQDNTKKGDVPVWFEVYAFNVTNAAEFAAGTDPKPEVVQLGPYVYRQNEVMLDFSFPSSGDRMKYVPWEYYTLDRSKSVGDPTVDVVTTASVPLAGVRNTVGDEWWEELAETVLMSGSNTSMFTTRTVSELVWGYQAPLLETLAKLEPSLKTEFGLQQNLTTGDMARREHGFDIQETGKSSLQKIRYYTQWANKTYLTAWATPDANKVVGGDALSFPPGVSSDDTFTVFVDSIFRHVKILSTKSDTETVHGIHLQIFRLDNAEMKNASLVPKNAAYNAFGPSGVTNLTQATGAPIFMSKPHFLDADPWFREKVVGMTPDRKKHDTIISVEPTTGVTMHAQKRLQVNVKIDPLILLNDRMESVYLPVAWFQEGSQIPEKEAKEFIRLIYGAQKMQKVLSYVGWVGGGVFLALAIGFAVYMAFVYKSKQEKAAEMYKPINTTITDDETVFDNPR
jgi:CD36 family